MQKLFKAGSVEDDPTKKASALVIEVSVIDGPARDTASFSRSSLDLLNDV